MKRILFSLLLVFVTSGTWAVATPGSRASVGRGNRVAVAVPAAATVTQAVEEIPEIEVVQEPEPIADNIQPEADVENKSSSFAEVFGGESDGVVETPLQRSIRLQKESLKLSAQAPGGGQAVLQASAGVDSAVVCDQDLRKCMSIKCGGAEFSKCFNDSDIDWGMKMDSCRKESKCTNDEFTAVVPEIKADRDQNQSLAGFSETIRCGTTYNNCIRNACGDDGYTRCLARGGAPTKCVGFATGYQKCVGKSGGDAAIAACGNEYKKCQESDSGLQSRAMDVFAGLRVEVEKNILNWEQSLYDLRASMANICQAGEGMFDQRSLECVYTVNLYADDDREQKQFASKKVSGDSPYTCNPDWFGIDITTFMENAFRLTRSQTAASSAMLGAGAGVAVGAITSGAIGRAIETKKAADALKKANEKPEIPAPTPQPEPVSEIPETPIPVAEPPEDMVPISEPIPEKVEETPIAEAAVAVEEESKDDAAAIAAARAAQLEAERKLAEEQRAADAAKKAAEDAAKGRASALAAKQEKCLSNMLGVWNEREGRCECVAGQNKVADGDSCKCASGYKNTGNGSCAITPEGSCSKKGTLFRWNGRDCVVKKYEQCGSTAAKEPLKCNVGWKNDVSGLNVSGTISCSEFIEGCISSDEYNRLNKTSTGFKQIDAFKRSTELVKRERAQPKTDYSDVLNSLGVRK